MENSQNTTTKRIEAVKELLLMADQMSRTSYFYLTEELENQYYSPDPTCPDIIKNMISEFLGSSRISDIPCQSGVHFILNFGIHFLVVHLPENEGYCIMGPLRYKCPDAKEVNSYIEKYNMQKNYNYILVSFLTSITDEHASSHPIKYIFKHIYGKDESDFGEMERICMEEIPEDELDMTPPPVSEMLSIDKKYEKEQELQKLISEGMRIEAGELLAIRDKTKYFRHSWLNTLHRLISLNVICKLALTNTSIPRVNIEHIYASYIREIAGNMDEIEAKEDHYTAKMLDDYCKLVRDHKTWRGPAAVQAMYAFILVYYSQKFTVNDMADYLGLSPNYVSSLFKKHSGMSVTQFVNHIRVHYAINMLTHSNLPIREIAEKVGFDDYNYFCRTFKKIIDETPAQYRKSALSGRHSQKVKTGNKNQ